MKKIWCLGVLFVGISAAAFSQIQESYLTVGFEFGNSFEKYPDSDFGYLGAPGFNLNGYQFYDLKDIGLFFHFAALFPVVDNNGGRDYLLQYCWIIGPGFRYALSDTVTLHFGVGLGMTWPLLAKYSENSVDYRLEAVNMGIGSDVGLKYDVNDRFYVDFGVTLSYDFINETTLYSLSADKNGDKNVLTRVAEDTHILKYALIGVNPYIGIGTNVYGERPKYGKPPKTAAPPPLD